MCINNEKKELFKKNEMNEKLLKWIIINLKKYPFLTPLTNCLFIYWFVLAKEKKNISHLLDTFNK